MLRLVGRFREERGSRSARRRVRKAYGQSVTTQDASGTPGRERDRPAGLLAQARRGLALGEPRPPTRASAAPFPVTPQMSEGPRCPRHTSLSLCQYLLTAPLPPSLEKLPGGRASSCPWSFPSAGDRLGEGSPPEVTDACLSAVWKRKCKPSREPRCTPRPASWSRAGPRCPAGRFPTPGGICWGLRLHG